jgi:hypothetical protein
LALAQAVPEAIQSPFTHWPKTQIELAGQLTKQSEVGCATQFGVQMPEGQSELQARQFPACLRSVQTPLQQAPETPGPNEQDSRSPLPVQSIGTQ